MLYAQGQCNWCQRCFLSPMAGRSQLHGVFQNRATKNPQGARILHSVIVFTDIQQVDVKIPGLKSRIRRSWYFGMPSISISFLQSPCHLPCLWLRNGCRFANIQRDEDMFGCPGVKKQPSAAFWIGRSYWTCRLRDYGWIIVVLLIDKIL